MILTLYEENYKCHNIHASATIYQQMDWNIYLMDGKWRNIEENEYGFGNFQAVIFSAQISAKCSLNIT